MSEYEMKEGVKLPEPEDRRPRRFYKDVSVEQAGASWRVMLDGRSVKTPAKRDLELPTRQAADLLAAEWAEQEERIDPSLMSATRLAFVALDRMGETREATAAEVARYASTDLLCFRAPQPQDLTVAQAAAWDPLLNWAETELDVRLRAVAGLLPVDQDPVALQRVLALAADLDDWRLTALAHATALCGSAVLGLALLRRHIDGEQAFALSTIDEHYQVSQWGEDAEAVERAAGLCRELVAVDAFLRSLDAVDEA